MISSSKGTLGMVRPVVYSKSFSEKLNLNKPLVSIITSTFNAARYLPAAIESIRTENYGNIEWIIIDACSDDGTVELIKQHEDIINYWISEPDKGIYDAWNKGLAVARGEWICFLGADDSLLPDAIADMLACQKCSTEPLDFICGRVEMYDGKKLIRTIGRPWDWVRFKRYMSVAHTGALHRRSYFQRYGLFDTAFRISGDYELLLRSGKTLKAGFVNSVVARMQIGGQSNGNSAVFDEALRVRLLHGLTTPFWGKLHAKWSKIKWQLRRYLVGI